MIDVVLALIQLFIRFTIRNHQTAIVHKSLVKESLKTRGHRNCCSVFWSRIILIICSRSTVNYLRCNSLPLVITAAVFVYRKDSVYVAQGNSTQVVNTLMQCSLVLVIIPENSLASPAMCKVRRFLIYYNELFRRGFKSVFLLKSSVLNQVTGDLQWWK